MNQNEPAVEFPLDEEWIIMNPPGHHPMALDFIAVNKNKMPYEVRFLPAHLFNKISTEVFFGWSRLVYSPVNGTIEAIGDGWPDRKDLNLLCDILKVFMFRPKMINRDLRPLAGNYVIISSRYGFALLAHLQCGSLKISVGQRVSAGQEIGKVGNSGASIIPHLHFQLMDDINPLRANIIPFRFRSYERWDGTEWMQVWNNIPKKGERIRSVKNFTE
jgi:hypothetical protein